MDALSEYLSQPFSDVAHAPYSKIYEPWKLVLSRTERLIFAEIYGAVEQLARSTRPVTVKKLKIRNGGIFINNTVFTESVGIDRKTVNRTIAQLAKYGLIRVVYDQEAKDYANRRLFWVNFDAVRRLDKAWMDYKRRNPLDNDDDSLDSEHEETLKEYILAEFLNIQKEFKTDFVQQKTDNSAQTPPGQNVQDTPGKMSRNTITSTLALSQDTVSEETVRAFAPDAANAAPRQAALIQSSNTEVTNEYLVTQSETLASGPRRKPKLVTSLSTQPLPTATMFEREDAVESCRKCCAPASKASIGAHQRDLIMQQAEEVIEYWNSFSELSRCNKVRNGNLSRTYQKIRATLYEIRTNGFYANKGVPAPYATNYSFDDIKAAIKKYATEWPADKRKARLLDFLWQDFGTNRRYDDYMNSRMLQCIHGPDPYEPKLLPVTHPDIVSRLRTQYTIKIGKGLQVENIPILNDYIMASNAIAAFREKWVHEFIYPDALSNLKIADIVVDIVQGWGSKYNQSTTALRSPSIYEDHLLRKLNRSGDMRAVNTTAAPSISAEEEERIARQYEEMYGERPR